MGRETIFLHPFQRKITVCSHVVWRSVITTVDCAAAVSCSVVESGGVWLAAGLNARDLRATATTANEGQNRRNKRNAQSMERARTYIYT